MSEHRDAAASLLGNSPQNRQLAGVVLAAGAGTRLLPLTSLRPKALCPVGGVPLVDLALQRLAAVTGDGPQRLAVNAHHGARAVVAHLRERVTVSLEAPQALGTAGALGALREWIDGRAVLLTNADLYLPRGLARFGDGWDGRRCRLLCAPATDRVDFRTPTGQGLRYVGVCLLPWPAVARLPATPSGLYEVLWRERAAAGELQLVTIAEVGAGEVALDCGTPRTYLEANLHASGGCSVVGAGAQVRGTLQRCVVWDGAWVGPDEHLVEVVRAGTRQSPVTVAAGPTPTRWCPEACW